MLAENTMDWTLQWREEGRQEGRREAEAEVLVRLMRRRFDSVDSGTRGRIERADTKQLLEWIDRFVTATSIAEVFGDD